MTTAIRLAAAAAAFVAAFPIHAQQREDALVVTATRFDRDDAQIPALVSVITKRELARSTALNLPDTLRTLAGVGVRSLYGVMGVDTAVDIRGFGETAVANSLVLLDGQRLNPVDLGGITWSAIPLEGVRRIEVMRGAGSVLYGDRAVGGVVNIVTDKSGTPRASAAATAGPHGYLQTTGHVAGGNDVAYGNLFANLTQSDGWRHNSQADQKTVSGRVGVRPGDVDLAFDYGVWKESSGLPGALFRAQYEGDPRFSRTPLDTQRREGWRLRPSMTWEATRDLTVMAEAYFDRSSALTDSVSFAFIDDRDRDTDSVSARLRWNHGIAGLESETVTGFEWMRGEVRSHVDFFGTNLQTGEQDSQAVFVQNTTRLADRIALTAGVRRQRVEQSAADANAGLRDAATRLLNAHELGVSVDIAPGLRGYGRVGRVFRFPSTDELFGFDPLLAVSVFRGDLRPQQGRIREAGVDWSSGQASLRAALYRLELIDEIGFDGSGNVNLPRTRRQGAEVEGALQLSDALRARAAWSRASARFREGANAGARIPLVPAYTLSAGLAWDAEQWGHYTVNLGYTGRRVFAGDFANTAERQPGYATLDVGASWNLKPWVLSLKILNALDRHYAQFAGVAFDGRLFYYPADPRSAFVTARYDFR